MPLSPEAENLDLDPADESESEPDAPCRSTVLPDDLEAPEADALEQAQIVEFDEDGERR